MPPRTHPGRPSAAAAAEHRSLAAAYVAQRLAAGEAPPSAAQLGRDRRAVLLGLGRHVAQRFQVREVRFEGDLRGFGGSVRAVQKGVEKLDLGTSYQWYNTITGQPIGTVRDYLGTLDAKTKKALELSAEVQPVFKRLQAEAREALAG